MKWFKLFVLALVLVTVVYGPSFTRINSNSAKVSAAGRERKPKFMVAKRLKDDATILPSTKEALEYSSGVAQEGRKALQIRKFYDELRSRLPFDPNLLTDAQWKEKIAHYPEFTSSLSSRIINGSDNKLRGVVIADTLYLPDRVEIAADTFILANRLVFSGRDVLIQGPHDIMVYTINGTATTVPARPGKITYRNSVDSEGFEKEFFSKNRITRGHITVRIGAYKQGIASGPNSRNEAVETTIDQSGTNGAPGAPGGYGVGGSSNGTAASGPNGYCASPPFVNGGNGLDGLQGGSASDGTDGGDGENGNDGGEITWPTISASDTDDYSFIAKGGDGGTGGNGGPGGVGGNGGSGGKGGDGVVCGCATGNGGKGGDAGRGGDGGTNGWGGNGGDGGDGGTVIATYMPLYGGSATANVDHGSKGFKGTGGQGGQGGFAGAAGAGGSAGATTCNVTPSAGSGGSGNTSGTARPAGHDGSDGDDGADGTQSITAAITVPDGGGGGGGGGCGGGACCFSLNPNPEGCGCTNYWWVLYVSWDGGQTWELYDMWYAGCW